MSNKCGCNIIGFGHINLYMLLIPLGAFFSAAKDIIVTRSEKLGKDDPKEPEKQHPVIITINYAFGLCLSFIFFAYLLFFLLYIKYAIKDIKIQIYTF